MKLTGTNRPITYTTHHPANPFKRGSHPRGGTKKQDCLRPLCGSQTTNPLLENPQLNNNTTVVTPQISHHQAHTARHGTGARVTAVIAWGKRPVPFRTRKLRPTAPMVLHPGGCGRVGHRRNIIKVESLQTHSGGSPTLTTHCARHPGQPPAVAPKPATTARGLPKNPHQLRERPPKTRNNRGSVGEKPATTARGSWGGRFPRLPRG